MAQKEKGREVLSAGAGLAAEVALESGGELGEITAVRARGYWEQVWIRFKKDKVAIASGFVIILRRLPRSGSGTGRTTSSRHPASAST